MLAWAGEDSVLKEALAIETGRVVCRWAVLVSRHRQLSCTQGHRGVGPRADGGSQSGGVRQGVLPGD